MIKFLKWAIRLKWLDHSVYSVSVQKYTYVIFFFLIFKAFNEHKLPYNKIQNTIFLLYLGRLVSNVMVWNQISFSKNYWIKSINCSHEVYNRSELLKNNWGMQKKEIKKEDT